MHCTRFIVENPHVRFAIEINGRESAFFVTVFVGEPKQVDIDAAARR
jgi:hypothetical protein